MKYLYMLLSLLMGLTPIFLMGQQASKSVEGIIYQRLDNDSLAPVLGAQVYWAESLNSTFSGMDGRFTLDKTDEKLLVVNYVGFEKDTIKTNDSTYVEIVLNKGIDLQTVEVKYRRKTTEISFIDPVNMQNINEKELLKAACCNLSESFETSPSVDASFTDAVTGTRQIEMLGLAGPNVLYTVENIPSLQGFSALYGLRFIPGTWIESIQLSKGIGSVANGYGGISGQINVEEKKAESGENNYLNLYYNALSRTELNYNHRRKLNDKISTALLLHGGIRPRRNDINDDGFMDQPEEFEYSLLNRWRYVGDHGWRSRLVIQSARIEQEAGQMEFERNKDNSGVWGMQADIERHSVWAKLGKVNEQIPWRSFGSQYKAEYYAQNSRYGNRNYSNIQRILQANLIYQTILSNTNHTIKMGISGMLDVRDEKLDSLSFDRQEEIVGGFGEYTFSPNDKFDVVAGLRIDHHNLFDWIATPRIHIRFAPSNLTVLRLSGGRAQRTSDIVSDNMGILASNRFYQFQGITEGTPYNLPATVAWNAGIGITQGFDLFGKAATAVAEFYRTEFTEGVVVDREFNPQVIQYYALDGEAYANSFQAQVDIQVIDQMSLRLAYRNFDVKTTYNNGLRQNPLVAQHRAFGNLSFETRNQWAIDYTVNWLSKQRIPPTEANPEDFRLPAFSPDYFLHNIQVSKRWGDLFDVYMGSSNVFDFRQEDAIISAENPFGRFFDAANIWAPVQGRNIYAGLRVKW